MAPAPIDPDLQTAIAVTNEVAAVSTLIAEKAPADSWLHKLAVVLPGLSVLALRSFRAVNAGEDPTAVATEIATDSTQAATYAIAQFAPKNTIAHEIADLLPGLSGIALEGFRKSQEP